MLLLIWIALILLVPVGAGVHVWWQLHRVVRETAAPPQLVQRPTSVAANRADGVRPH